MNAAFYAASEDHVLTLDAEGICMAVHPPGDAAMERCVGAQFVATLDPLTPGLLGIVPQVGVSLLFVRLDGKKASLLRFGPLVRFDAQGEPMTVPDVSAEAPKRPRRASGVVIRKRDDKKILKR